MEIRFNNDLMFPLQRANMEFEEKFTDDGAIVALKATLEGPRRILLVASKDAPLCIRDAMNGLRLRVIAKFETFNSMIVDKNLIYCATNRGEVLVLSFHVSI